MSEFKNKYYVEYYRCGEVTGAAVNANSEQDAIRFIEAMTSDFGGVISITVDDK